ncbi:hypothetical protein [Pelagibaculum spongiae]|uniref:Uncharacterized protein n=1 Tax=Pelagibaculum spongiae TaxID=2080658 RepID=A0A2V1GYX4_9GAMM|nr:hypothetical protein [Pelagibaculum spongiae]PVZ70174.1 hypothetical protein DC094_06110 [Pelagibaculum spongiae]
MPTLKPPREKSTRTPVDWLSSCTKASIAKIKVAFTAKGANRTGTFKQYFHVIWENQAKRMAFNFSISNTNLLIRSLDSGDEICWPHHMLEADRILLSTIISGFSVLLKTHRDVNDFSGIEDKHNDTIFSNSDLVTIDTLNTTIAIIRQGELWISKKSSSRELSQVMIYVEKYGIGAIIWDDSEGFRGTNILHKIELFKDRVQSSYPS